MNHKGHFQGEFLPPDLLANLTSPSKALEDLGPSGNGKLKKGKAFPKVYPKRPPDNVWNHPKSRERFKHLTEQPACTCGAGRDISFLYDSAGEKAFAKITNGSMETPSPLNRALIDSQPSNVTLPLQKSRERGIEQAAKDGSVIPETIIPSEFHIVKNLGVQGLEFHDEKFSTKTEDHEHHLTLFPSMKPSGRQEALQLKHAMNTMLKKAGVDENEIKDSELPTQIHNLLELVKKEQNIYNIVFNEIIRQVTVECVERGEVLAELRKRYALLLDKVPRQVKSLHEEVLAQRALDRRLTEELTRFKSSITLLTRELDEVQAHDREVTRQAQETQEALNEALKESEKNASLLSEYHELYELQRKRLEFQISKLIEERNLWAGASYTLSLKAAARHNLTTAKRLHLHEKAWNKLASHFAVVLKDLDSLELENLTNNVQSWQEVSEKFNKKLLNAESEAYRKFKSIKSQVEKWGQDFQRVVTPTENTVHAPTKDVALKLFDNVKSWEEVFNYEVERFSGDALLSCEDDLVNLNKFVDNWIDIGSRIFRRHSIENQSKHRQHTEMISLNQDVDHVHEQFKLRMTGENGLAKGLIHFINVLDNVGNKLNAFAKGGEILLDPEWVRLADYLQNEWPELLTELIDLVTPPDEKRLSSSAASMKSYENFQRANKSDVGALSQRAQKWLSDTTNAIENAGGSLLDQISSGHSGMIRWMVTILLRLAPDLEPNPVSQQTNGGEKQSLTQRIGAAIVAESTYDEIKQRAGLLFRQLRRLTNSLTSCSMDFVLENMQKKKDEGDELAEMELNDLKKMKVECDGWIKTAVLLIQELTEESLTEEDLEDLNVQQTPRTDRSSKVTVQHVKASELTETAKDTDNVPDENMRKDSVETTVSQPPVTSIAEESPAVTVENNIQEYQHKESGDSGKEVDNKTQRESVEEHISIEEPESKKDASNEIASNDQNADSLVVEKSDFKDNENTKSTAEVSDSQAAEMHVLGHDDNVKIKSLDELSVSQQAAIKDPLGKQQDLHHAIDALATVEKLQKQLIDSEERAQAAEERAITAETELKKALERVRALERSIARETPESGMASNQRPLSEMTSVTETPAPLKEENEGRSSVMSSRGSSKNPLAKSSDAKSR